MLKKAVGAGLLAGSGYLVADNLADSVMYWKAKRQDCCWAVPHLLFCGALAAQIAHSRIGSWIALQAAGSAGGAAPAHPGGAGGAAHGGALVRGPGPPLLYRPGDRGQRLHCTPTLCLAGFAACAGGWAPYLPWIGLGHHS